MSQIRRLSFMRIRILPPKMMRIRIRITDNNNILLIANVEACHVIMFVYFRLLAQKYNCDKVICRKCYARLHPRYRSQP
jgi:hypothetical protein